MNSSSFFEENDRQAMSTIVLVGPTSPWELMVFNNGKIIYNNDLECIACYKSTCSLKVNCMNTLSPDYVYLQLKEFLTN